MSERQDRVVVTGAGGALGRACCASAQLELGHRVLAVDIDVEAGTALADELGAGDQLYVEIADVTDDVAVERYVRVAVELFGGIDGFFNNAGVEGCVTPIVAYPIDVVRPGVAVNLRGVFLGLKHVMTAMAAGGGGSIVNTASVAGLVGVGGLSAYVATKHAVVG